MRDSYPSNTWSVRDVVTLRDYIDTSVLHARYPYQNEPVIGRFLRAMLLLLLKGIERLFGQSLLIENKNRELSAFSPSTRRLLLYLLKQGLIYRWRVGITAVTEPRPFSCQLQLGQITVGSFTAVRPGDMLCSGTHTDINTAVKIACAELVERSASIQYSNLASITASINDMKRAGRSICAYSVYQKLSEEYSERKLRWIRMKDLHTGSTTWFPVSTVFLFYGWQYDSENLFLDLTSSGVAAHTSVSNATLSALYELIERDAFLMHWLKRITPKRLSLETLPSTTHNFLAVLKRRNIKPEIIICENDLEVPVLVCVLNDEISGAVHVEASASYNINQALHKVLIDALRWNPQWTAEKKIPFENLMSIDDRKQLWSTGDLNSEIDFLLSGQVISYQALEQEQGNSFSNQTEELNTILKSLRRLEMNAYIYEFKNDVAHEVGLSVVRAIVPELIPMYFVERMRPIHLTRLKDSNTLNPTPHPFV